MQWVNVYQHDDGRLSYSEGWPERWTADFYSITAGIIDGSKRVYVLRVTLK